MPLTEEQKRIQRNREIAEAEAKRMEDIGKRKRQDIITKEIAETRAEREGKVAVPLAGERGFEELTPEQAALKPSVAEQERKMEMETKAEETLPGVFEEAGVFKDIEQMPIIPPEQENLSVILRIGESLIPKSLTKAYKTIDTLGGLADFKKPISQAEITMINDDLKNVIEIETSAEIDARIEETEKGLVEMGIPVLPLIGAAVITGAIAAPTKEFVGTDGQIRSLELALSQYNEMITIPARSVLSGLPPEMAFDKYDKMEADILALEEQLKLSALTSTKVALALRGRGVEARLFKLKEKLQEGRRLVALRMTQEAFGEVEVSKSMAFLRRLQNERKK